MSLQCHLESLAPELLFPILTQLPDLESLDSLLRASPAAFRVFNSRAIAIFEAIFSSGVTHEYTCALIRIIAKIRSKRLPHQVYDWDSFTNLVRHETTPHRYDPPMWEFPPTTLSQTPITIMRGLLTTNRKIGRLSVGCLEYYLTKFKRLRPSHLTDKDFKFESTNNPDEPYIGSYQLKPAETPFPVRDIGPPTWVEYQRVLRAFWRSQLFDELISALDDSSIIWPEDRLKWLRSRIDVKPIMVFYNVPTSNLLGQDEFAGDPEPYICDQDTLLEHELLLSVRYYVQENKKMIKYSKYRQLRRDWPTYTSGSQEDRETVGSCHLSRTWHFFFRLGGRMSEHWFGNWRSPLQHVQFEPFRRLGFAIWDTPRLSGYGFLSSEILVSSLYDPYYVAWRSILGQDVLAEVERVNRKWEEMEVDD